MSPFKSAGASVQSNTGSRGVRITGSNTGHTMFRGSVKSTGYPPHSPVSPSLPLPCVTVCHYISAGLYHNSDLTVSNGTIICEQSGSDGVSTCHGTYISSLTSLCLFLLSCLVQDGCKESHVLMTTSSLYGHTPALKQTTPTHFEHHCISNHGLSIGF